MSARDVGYLYEVYPRVCGGTSMIGEGADLVEGLSPRVRGNQSQAADDDP